MTQRKFLPAALALAASVALVGCQVDAASAPVQDDQSALMARLKNSSVVLDLASSDVVAITTNSLYSSEYRPENAFDNMPAGGWTQWISDHDFRPFTRASVIQIEYATPKEVRGYTLVGRYESLKDRLPKDWVLQGSNDDAATVDDAVSDSKWATLDAAVGMDIGAEWKSSTNVAELTRAISRPAAYTRYRLCVTAVNGSSVVDLIEIELLADSVAVVPPKCDTTPLGDIYTSLGKDGSGIKTITTNSIYSSSYMPGNAFDQMPAGGWTQWISNHDFRPFTRASVLQVEYLQPRTVASYILVGRYESLKDRLPKDWVLQGSNDTGATVLDPASSGKWTELDKAEGIEIGDEWNSATSLARLTRQIPTPGSYQKYRICVTAVNGSSVVDLIEIELDEAEEPVAVEPPVPVAPIYTSVGKDGSGIKTITTNSIYSSSYMPGNAFDQMPAGGWTQWISNHDFRPFTRASVLQVEYLQPRTVASYTLVGRYESLKDRLPKDWVLQGTNDTGASVLDPMSSGKWAELDKAEGIEIGDEWNSATSIARLTRQIPTPASYLKYRICVTAVNGSSVVDLIEIELDEAKEPVVVEPPVPVAPIYTSVGKYGSGIKTITTNSIYSSSYMPGNAFDQMPAGGWTQWISNHDFRPFTRASVLQVEYLQRETVGSYTLVGRYESLKDRLPKDWVLQGSNDTGASVLDPASSGKWTELDKAVGIEIGDEWNSETSVARLTRQIPTPGSYLKYRICVTAVNGSSVVDLIEIELNRAN